MSSTNNDDILCSKDLMEEYNLLQMLAIALSHSECLCQADWPEGQLANLGKPPNDDVNISIFPSSHSSTSPQESFDSWL